MRDIIACFFVVFAALAFGRWLESLDAGMALLAVMSWAQVVWPPGER